MILVNSCAAANKSMRGFVIELRGSKIGFPVFLRHSTTHQCPRRVDKTGVKAHAPATCGVAMDVPL